MMTRLFKNLIIVVFVLLCISTDAQTLSIHGRTGAAEVKVMFYADSNVFSETTTTANGKYKIRQIATGKFYKLVFAKQDHITKFVTLDLTTGSLTESTAIDVDVVMEQTIDFPSAEIFNEPIAKCKIGKSGFLEWDIPYISKQQKKIAELRKPITEKKEENLIDVNTIKIKAENVKEPLYRVLIATTATELPSKTLQLILSSEVEIESVEQENGEVHYQTNALPHDKIKTLKDHLEKEGFTDLVVIGV